jgi:hypothetical protein
VSGGQSRERRATFVGVVALIAIVAAGLTLFKLGGSATGSGRGGELAQMSNEGQPIQPGKGQREELENVGAVSATRMASRAGRGFYRLVRPDGSVCFAVDMTGGDHVGNTSCLPPGTAFPTPSSPVLDLSVFESTSHVPGDVQMVSAQGFAADGVRSVALLDSSGHVIARAPVAGNVYAVNVPAGRVATTVVAYDARRAEVYRVP